MFKDYFVKVWQKKDDGEVEELCIRHFFNARQVFEWISEQPGNVLYSIYEGECICDKS